jgi:hypothetical protein
MTVSSLSICLALKRIADIICGTRPETIQIKVIDPRNGILTVSLPAQYQLPIAAYLAQHIGIQQPKQEQPLLLTSHEAVALVELALRAAPSLKAA